MFARSVGSAVGVAAFGAVVNAVTGAHPSASTLGTGVHRVFVGILAITIGIGLLELLMPVRVTSSDQEPSPAS
jgi:hypothetical protein